MRTYLIGTIASATLLSACAAQPEEPPDPGPYPTNHEEIVSDWLQQRLKDPYSIRDLSMTTPVAERTWLGILDGGWFDGYRMCVTYNAKNSFGAYVGLKDYTFVLKDGAVAETGVSGPLVFEGC